MNNTISSSLLELKQSYNQKTHILLENVILRCHIVVDLMLLSLANKIDG